MKHAVHRTTMTMAAVMAWALLAISGEAKARGDDEFELHRAVVRLVPGASIAAFNQDYQTTTLDEIPERLVYLLQLPETIDEEQFVQDAAADPRVVYCELNYLGTDVNPDGSTQSIFLSITPGAYNNDPSILKVRGIEAQSLSTGRGIMVAVVDSGVDGSHPLLQGRIAEGGFNFIDLNPNTNDVGDGLDSNGNGVADEMVGHGTLVAGLIARMAPEAELLPVRVMDSDGRSTVFGLARGIYHALDLGADVINVSLGTQAEPLVLREAAAEAEAAGVILVGAAGNDDTSDPARNPAGSSDLGVIAVGGTQLNDERAAFSNFGTWLSLCAPAVEVRSLVPGGGYGKASGTSFAAPFVSGTAALLRSICPVASTGQIRGRILDHAVSIDALNPSYAGLLGAGRLDAATALGVDGAPPAFSCDLDGDRIVDVEDLHLLHAAPRDVNGDGSANSIDIQDLRAWLRLDEAQDVGSRDR